MKILITLIAFYMIVLLIGKYAKRINYLGYLFIGILTCMEVAIVLYLLFTMETPSL